MPKKSDIIISLIIGEAIAVSLIPFVYNNLGALISFLSGVVIAVIFLPVISVAGLFTAHFLSKFFQPFWRVAKFIQVGVLNTAIDLGSLNIFILLTGATKGIIIGGVNAPGFIIAAINSYFWNKFWVFKETSEKHSYSDILGFSVVSITSLFVNSAIVIIMTTYMPPLFGLTDVQWANFSKIPAAFGSFAWNFTGYKMFVFRKKAEKENFAQPR